MPTVYRIYCDKCNYPDPGIESVAAYVNSDGQKRGRVMPAGYLALEKDGDYICLSHPLESSILEANGYTWKKAHQEKKLFYFTYKICQKCGSINEEKSLSSSPPGCITLLLTFICSLSIFVGMFYFFSFVKALLFSFILYIFFILVFPLIERRKSNKLREKNKGFNLQGCQECGSENLIEIDSIGRKKLICPNCKELSLHCEIAGIS